MRIILTVLLCLFLFNSASFAAFTGDNVNDVIRVANNTRLNLPDANWCIAGWVKAASTSVSASFSRLVSRNGNNSTGNGDFEFGITSAGIGTAYDELTFIATDDDGTALSLTGTTSDFASNTNWTHVAAERSGNNFTIYVNGSSVATTSNASFDAASTPTDGNYSGDLTFFNREHGTSFRGLNGDMADWAMWDGEACIHLAELVKGFSGQFYPTNRSWYAPMITNYQELEGGLTVTNSGTTTSAHPPLIFPSNE